MTRLGRGDINEGCVCFSRVYRPLLKFEKRDEEFSCMMRNTNTNCALASLDFFDNFQMYTGLTNTTTSVVSYQDYNITCVDSSGNSIPCANSVTDFSQIKLYDGYCSSLRVFSMNSA